MGEGTVGGVRGGGRGEGGAVGGEGGGAGGGEGAFCGAEVGEGMVFSFFFFFKRCSFFLKRKEKGEADEGRRIYRSCSNRCEE